MMHMMRFNEHCLPVSVRNFISCFFKDISLCCTSENSVAYNYNVKDTTQKQLVSRSFLLFRDNNVTRIKSPNKVNPLKILLNCFSHGS